MQSFTMTYECGDGLRLNDQNKGVAMILNEYFKNRPLGSKIIMARKHSIKNQWVSRSSRAVMWQAHRPVQRLIDQHSIGKVKWVVSFTDRFGDSK